MLPASSTRSHDTARGAAADCCGSIQIIYLFIFNTTTRRLNDERKEDDDDDFEEKQSWAIF